MNKTLTFGMVGLLLILSLKSQADCQENLRDQAAALMQKQDEEYKILSGDGITPGNEPVLKIGTNSRAVLVAHGFLASPFEMSAIIEKLSAEGYTVYAPLIYGFGGNVKMANLASMEKFQQSIVDGVELLNQCYSDVSLVGLSWGATLVADYVLNNPAGSKITSLSLFSPYFKAKVPFAAAINKKTSQYFSTFPKFVASLMSFNDQRASRMFPEHYLSALPLLAVNIVLDYHDLLIARDARLTSMGLPLTSSVPTILAVTLADGTVDPKFAQDYVHEHFTNSSEFSFPASLHIPHQIVFPQVNDHYTELEDWWFPKFSEAQKP